MWGIMSRGMQPVHQPPTSCSNPECGQVYLTTFPQPMKGTWW
ncbi:hypothetical protein E2C01_072791 [Portunus trituberculatus]|uniref:Uncharacterized protein n=1 Tax=Portunus trituberculatus TaxID=210409 RepID=A0A5B7I9W2_PORTR|nr:hypothetical protein [Portunus trituberculatus]